MGVLKQKHLSVPECTSTNLTCRETVDAMGDFVSASISLAHRLQFEEHLKGCGECAVFLRTYKKTIEAMRHDLGSHCWSTPILKLRKPPHDRYDVKLTEELLS